MDAAVSKRRVAAGHPGARPAHRTVHPTAAGVGSAPSGSAAGSTDAANLAIRPARVVSETAVVVLSAAAMVAWRDANHTRAAGVSKISTDRSRATQTDVAIAYPGPDIAYESLDIARPSLETNLRLEVMKPPLLRAIRLYHAFTRYPPTRMLRARHPRVMPPVVVHLGHLLGLIYRVDRGTGTPYAYIHFMEQPPCLVANPAGNQLYIIGGQYQVTSRGIEG